MSRRRRKKKPRLALPPLALRPVLMIGGGVLLFALIVFIVMIGNNDPAGAFARAEAYEAAGEMRSARVEAMNAVAYAPDNEAAWRLLARSEIAIRDGAAAIGTLNRAASAGIPEDRTRHLRTEALLISEDGDAALAHSEAGPVADEFFADIQRVRGRAFQANGKIADAARSFTLAIENDPESVGLWLDVARFRQITGEQAGAIDAVDQALSIDETDIDALILKGRMVRDQYGLVASLAWFDRALIVDPDHIDAHLERAATLGDVGQMTEMLDATRRVLELEPGHPRAFYLQAVLAARARNFPLAHRLAILTDGRLDGWPGMLLLEASIDYQSQNYEAAIRRLDDLLERQPANIAAIRLLGAAKFGADDARATIRLLEPLVDRPDADSYVLTLVGRAWEREGDLERAAPYLARAARPIREGLVPLGAPPEDAAALALIEREALQTGSAGAEVALIRAYLSLGRIRNALSRAAALSANNPGAPDAHLIYGDALGAAGRYQDAAAAYANASNIRFSERAALGLYESLQRAGLPEQALRTLALYREQNPRNVSTAMISARLNLQTGRWPQAAAILEQLRARLGDRDASLLANLAWAHYEMGNADRALALARRAYRLLPTNASTSEIYGWIAADSGVDRALGIELLEKAQRLAPDNTQIADRLAILRAG